MLKWFFSWRKKRRDSRQLAELVAARAIMPFWDGKEVRYADPFAVWRTLTQDPNVNLERAEADVEQGIEPTTTQVLDLICRAFGVRRWDPKTNTGLPDWHVIGLLRYLAAYTEAVKKNTSDGPISSPPMDSTSSTGQADPDAVTKSSGDSN